MKKITNTKYSFPCIGITKKNEKIKPIEDFAILFDYVKDYGNIGTIIRTGKAYGINNYLNTNEDFDPYTPKTIDASRGTVFKVNFQRFNSSKNVIKYLKENGYQIIATSPHGKSLQSTLKLEKKPIVLVVGNETSGISKEVLNSADHIVQIPMSNEIESLNVGVASGISIYELKLKEILTMLSEKIISTLGREINVTSQLIRKAFNIKLKEVSDYTGDQIIFLMVLKRENKISKEQIKEQFGYFDEKLEFFLKKLYEENLIIDHEKEIAITPLGEEILSKLWPLQEKTEELILNDFNEDEKNNLKKSLKKIQNNCLKIIEK
jgi:TrmH family RNA methyltransferase